MLCPSCRRQLDRRAVYCGSCGAPLAGQSAPLELVLADRTRVAVVEEMTIGRAPSSTVRIDDPTVSRTHARISSGNGNGAATLEDAGSSHGTYVDGARISGPIALRDGLRVRLGDQELVFERRREDSEAGRTIVVRPGASLIVPAAGPADVAANATQFGMHPRVRSGYALKRLDESEGSRRWVLRDLSGDKYLRLSDNDARLFEAIDGSRSLVDLIGLAEQRHGTLGPARLARLLADLGERGFLVGVETSAGVAAPAPRTTLQKLFTPRVKSFPVLGGVFERLYRAGGWILFLPPVLWAIAVLCVAGLGVFAYLVAGRYGTPFIVADHLGLGGLVFLAGRFVVVAVHECAHGLTMASFGRKVHRAGLKLLFIFPYAFVDTSEAWFEPRRRRIAISAAGPVSDFTLGAIFSVACLAAPDGLVRDIFFQLAFAAYVGAFFNLNPFIDRDGYQILVDWLREPGLRRRAKEQFERRLSGKGTAEGDSPVLARYSLFGLGWFALMGFFVIFFTLRYKPIIALYAPDYVVWIVLVTLWLGGFLPLIVVLAKPLTQRWRGA
jgi:putative peptide zinc metalloprotease protein